MAEPEPVVASPGRSFLGGHYVLFILCVVGIFNFIDRQILSILLQPVKQEFHASDTAMGLLTGVVFAACYALSSIPLARLADRYSRKWVMAICLVVWSVFTSLGGFAQSFGQLAFSRLGVAVAEGGASPIASSVIADLYPIASRGTALAAFAAAQSLGIGAGVFLGGWLSQTFGWRASFVVVGAPGVLLAILFMLTVKEPPRGFSDRATTDSDAPTLGETLRQLWRFRSYRCIAIANCFSGMAGYGVLTWGPTFLIRVHRMSQLAVGASFGLTVAASLIAGAMLGGMLGDRVGRRDLRGYLWVAGTGPLLSVFPGLVFVFSSDWRVAVPALFCWSLCLTTYQPTCNAIGQTLAPSRMRAMAAVILTLGPAAVGTGLSPLLIGALNDWLTPSLGAAAVRYSLATVCLFALVASALVLLGSRWVRQDYRSLHGREHPSL